MIVKFELRFRGIEIFGLILLVATVICEALMHTEIEQLLQTAVASTEMFATLNPTLVR